MIARSRHRPAAVSATALLLANCARGVAGDGTDAASSHPPADALDTSVHLTDSRVADSVPTDATVHDAPRVADDARDAVATVPDVRDASVVADVPDATSARDATSPPPDVAVPPLPDVVTPDVTDATVVPLPDARMCPTAPVTASDRDAWRAGTPPALPATMRTSTAGGHSDVYLAGPSGVAEIGMRLDWGGTVVFFGQQGISTSNVIDANDTGRELQLALYDPTRAVQVCAASASCTGASPCGNSITYLGWDPVQGGDECGNGGRIVGNAMVDDRLVLTVQPLQWNPDWDATSCTASVCDGVGRAVDVTYTLSFAFVHPNVVEVEMAVDSSETIDHPITAQEFPTLYVGNGANRSTDLPLLLDSAGNPVAVTTPANDGFTMADFTSTSGWVTWQHASRDYGVGLAMDHRGTSWQAWAGSGRGAPYFHNVRANQSFGLAAHGAVRGRAFMVLGNFDTVSSLFDQVFAQRAPSGVVDVPAAGSTTTGPTVHVRGWTIDDGAVTDVVVRVDGADITHIPRNDPRGDVCAVYPNYNGCPNVGFDGQVTLPALDGCVHVMSVVARDASGNETVLGERLVR